MLDILIRNAKIYDGTGNPWYRADVGVKGGRITAIGVVKEKARKRITATKLALAPGFIDVHMHADGIADCPTAPNMLRQGVTTVVSGNCGGSAFPIRKMLEKVTAARPAINYATLVGHGSIRSRVLGLAQRKPNRRELLQMGRLAEQAMREGAIGMSTGLFYVPGAYAEVSEIVEVAKVVAARGGVYASHMRTSAGSLFRSIHETAAVGRDAGLPVEISHLKVLHKRGVTKKNRVDELLALISRYREEGVDVTCDVYPYTASATSLSAVAIPAWVSTDDKLKERLQDRAVRKRISKQVASNIGWMGGADKVTIAEFAPDRSVEGKSLLDAARARKQNVVAAAMDMIVEGAPSCLFHCMRPEDVSRILCSDFAMVACDGGIVPARKGVVHPRNYGTFPRVLREYVREKKLLTLEQAIRKMSSLPARKFGLRDRGLVNVGMAADLVLFDPETVSDQATFDSPHTFPIGIKSVIVNGGLAWNGRSISKKRTGAVIRGGS